MPVLAALPQPLALLEVGASAGLCLQPDRYAYRYDDRPVLGESPLVLSCRDDRCGAAAALACRRWSGGAGWTSTRSTSATTTTMRWLRSLVWPEQTERFAVLQRRSRSPAPIRRRSRRATSSPISSRSLRRRRADATLVIYHSAVLAYLDADGRARFVDERTRDRCATVRRSWIVERGARGVRSRTRSRPAQCRSCSRGTASRSPGPARTVIGSTGSIREPIGRARCGRAARCCSAVAARRGRHPRARDRRGQRDRHRHPRAAHVLRPERQRRQRAVLRRGRRTGRLRATFRVPGATNHDWEDLAVAPDAGGTPSVWLADTGDNDADAQRGAAVSRRRAARGPRCARHRTDRTSGGCATRPGRSMPSRCSSPRTAGPTWSRR